MPGLGKYGTVYDKLAKKRPLLEKLFKSSPQYDGDLTHSKLVAISNAKLVPTVQQGDIQMFPVPVDLNFDKSPKLTDVTTSTKENHKGWPSTPFTPNQVSPGADPAAVGDVIATNVNPNKQDDPGLTPTDINSRFVADADGTLDPNKSAADVGSLQLNAQKETLVLGQSSKK